MQKPPSRERPVYAIRLAVAERRLLEAAAAKGQLYLSEFIRESALENARFVLGLGTHRRELIEKSAGKGSGDSLGDSTSEPRNAQPER